MGMRPGGGGPGPGTVFAIGAVIFLALAIGLGLLLVRSPAAPPGRAPVQENRRATPETFSPRHHAPPREPRPAPEEEKGPDAEASPEDIWLSVAREKYEKAEQLVKEYGPYETPRVKAFLESLTKSYADTPYGPKARKLLSSLAPLLTPREVYVVKGFPNADWNGLDTVFEPETRTFSRDDSFQVGRWERRAVAQSGHIDLLPGTWQTAYVYFTINSQIAQKVMFSVGTDDTAKIWLNSNLIYTNPEPRGARRGEDTAGGELVRGANSVLMKVCQGDGGWGLYVDVAARQVTFGP